MKEYGRRDFLKALGIGAGAATAVPKTERIFPAGSKIEVSIASTPLTEYVPASFVFPAITEEILRVRGYMPTFLMPGTANANPSEATQLAGGKKKA